LIGRESFDEMSIALQRVEFLHVSFADGMIHVTEKEIKHHSEMATKSKT
jgi:hypothetical protein